jgi:hypothetical protein
LSSVLAQTHPPLEIIVVDDGSTDDGTQKVLKINNPKINLVRQENKGPGAARNAGLAIAKGKYISFLDADDEWLPSFLETGLSLLEDIKENVTVVFTGYYHYPSMKINSEGLQIFKGVYKVTPDTDIKLIKKIDAFASMGFSIISTEVARKWGGYFDGFKCFYGEDRHFFLKLIFNENLGIIPEPHGLYHMEASELFGCGLKTIPPLEPFLIDPNDIIACCPTAKKHILKEFLSLRALNRAIMYSKSGQRKIAVELLDRFCTNGKVDTKVVMKARLLVHLAPALPSIRWIWRSAKSIAHIVYPSRSRNAR